MINIVFFVGTGKVPGSLDYSVFILEKLQSSPVNLVFMVFPKQPG